MTTALIYDEIFLAHEMPEGHPESPERLRAVMQLLQERGLLDHPDLRWLRPRAATDDELAAVHTRAHIARIEEAAQKAGAGGKLKRLDPDTYVSPRSAEVARMAAGAALVGIDAVLAGDAQNAFALVRPPGHHAEPDIAMGFCLYNNIAVAAHYAQQRGASKVLIVDYDVHHGNGTQAAFYDDPTVAYFSTHQAPFYPGTGAYDEVGEGTARLTNCNAPVPADTIFDLYDAIFREVLYPFADRFKPDLILLSAGYDTHWRDPLAGVLLDVMGQAVLTRYVQDLANTYCDSKLVAVLEGGYDLDALSEGVAATLGLLLGVTTINDTLGPPPVPGTRWNADAVTDELRNVQELRGYRRRPRLPGPAPEEHEDESSLLPKEWVRNEGE